MDVGNEMLINFQHNSREPLSSSKVIKKSIKLPSDNMGSTPVKQKSSLDIYAQRKRTLERGLAEFDRQESIEKQIRAERKKQIHKELERQKVNRHGPMKSLQLSQIEEIKKKNSQNKKDSKS